MEAVCGNGSYIPREEIKPPFDKVPSDVIKLILSFLDIQSLKNSRRVCRAWSSFYSIVLSATIKKVSLKLKECLIDVSVRPYFDPIKKVCFKDEKSFCLQHESSWVSFWTTAINLNLNYGSQTRWHRDPTGRDLMQESYFQLQRIHSDSNDWKFSQVDDSVFCQTIGSKGILVFNNKLSNSVITWPKNACSVAILLDAYHVDENDSRRDGIYLGTKKGELFGWNFDSEKDFTTFEGKESQFEQTFEKLYPETMVIGEDAIVIACNSFDNSEPSSCVQWRNHGDGSLKKEAFIYNTRISSFNLIKDEVNSDQEIHIIYQNRVVLKHNLLENTTKLIKLPDHYTAPTLFSFSPYLVAYNIKSTNTKALMLDEESLAPLFEFDVGPLLNKGESLLGLQKYPGGSNELWVITTSRILIAQLEFKSVETELEGDAFDRPHKRQKKL